MMAATGRAGLLALGLLAGCGPNFTAAPPATTPPAPLPAGELLVLGADGAVFTAEDPRAPRVIRRADLDVAATMIAPDVALVARPATGAPAYVSNLLGDALIRRFAGHAPLDQALGAAEVFVITPRLAAAPTYSGALVVDWTVATDRGAPLGAVYAERRLTGTVTTNPWTALTPEDAEHIALQTAAELTATPAVRDAVVRAAAQAALDATPSPAIRPGRGDDGAAPATPAPRPRR